MTTADRRTREREAAEILIVEDSPTQAEQLSRMLRTAGYRVRVAAHGREALAAMRQRPPTLVVSDVVMPQMDGYALCRAIKADSALRGIPVVLVTMLSDPADVVKALQCGADNFVRKPYEEQYLLARIKIMLMHLELRGKERTRVGVEVYLEGQRHLISAERQQLLDLLVSSYEEAVRAVDELRAKQTALAQSHTWLDGLYRIAREFNAATTVRDVLDRALDGALALPGVRAGWVALRDGDTGMRVVASRNLPPALEAPGALDGDCSCRRLLLSGKLTDTITIPQCERLQQVGGDTGGLRGHATVPLRVGERVVGLVNLAGPGHGVFADEALKILRGVGNQASTAIGRAQLIEHLEEEVQRRTDTLAAEVAARRRAEEARARLAAVVEATPQFVGTTDPSGRLLYVNAGGRTMLGLGLDEDISGMTILDLVVGRMRPVVVGEVIPATVREGAWRGELVFLARGGREIPVLLTGLAHRAPDGTVEFLSSIACDLSERERAEEERLRKEAAERANRAKSEFLSQMSHELRTPLNAILGFAQLLEMASLDAQHRESVGHILTAGQHLLALINETLDIARIEAGRLAVSPEPVSVRQIVQESLDLIAPRAAEEQVRVEATLSDLRSEYVQADQQRLKQVILNLLSNAVKYNRKGGEVTVSCEDTAGGRLRLKVADTGPGIAPEKIERLFTPFERLGAEQTAIEGAGLGLALSKRLAEAMGGTLGVASVVGQGSTFWVELLVAAPPATPQARSGEDTMAPAKTGGLHPPHAVLYVEDNLSTFKLVQHILAQRRGATFLCAMQGRLALDLAGKHHPDLILLDLHLPDLPGEEVLLRLRASPETRRIPVVIMSADATPGQAERLLASGARAYLSKPLDVRKFLALWDEIFARRDSP
jgi:PAS domain S-box-containing protein